MDIRLAIVCSLSAALACGCGREGSPQAAATPDVISVRTSDASLALVEVGRETVTCGDVRARLAFERGVWKLRNLKPGDDEGERRLDAFTAHRLPQMLPELIRQKATEIGAREKGIALTADEQEREVTRQLKSFRLKEGLEAFAEKIGCDADYARRQLCDLALLKKLREAVEPDSATVTEGEIDEGLQRLADYYDRAVASNAVTWATCSNLVGRLEKGLDFAEAGETYGYDNGGEGEKWASFSREEIEDAKLRDWAFSAPLGAMRIFELDDGISIVKVIGVENRAGDKAEVDLARINFAMVEPEPEPRTREHVRAELLKWKANEAQKRLIDALLKRHPLRFLREKAQMVY